MAEIRCCALNLLFPDAAAGYYIFFGLFFGRDLQPRISNIAEREREREEEGRVLKGNALLMASGAGI